MFADIQDAAEGAGAFFATRLKTGFWVLDVMTQGLRQGSLVVLAGSTGMGKTSLALNIARNICLQGDGDAPCGIDSPVRWAVISASQRLRGPTLSPRSTRLGLRIETLEGPDPS
ncbi:MAG: hypothetical protein EBX49_12475, partial [Synechococcaceae bacterium WB8_1B_136]|nr:hypothetical protein [Synechococcaceae bacterium WB8_1B_136]